MIHDMKLINNVMKTSMKSYIFFIQMNLSIKDIFKKLVAKYQRSNNQIIEQIFDQYRLLQQSSFKQKIEKWVAEWKTLYQEIVDMNLLDQYENEKIFVNEFFKTKKKWIFQFCESWVRILKNSFRPIKFYETVKKYRIEPKTYLDEMKDSSWKVDMANVASLQGQKQQPQKTAKQKNKSAWLTTKKCVCGLMHLFEKCPHLVQLNQPPGWTESKKKGEEIRQQIRMQLIEVFKSIKRISDTDILDDLTEDLVNKGNSQKENESSRNVAEFPQYCFVNTASFGINKVKKLSNFLTNSVIYDSESNYSLTHDKSRFRGEIWSASEK